jgi:hypothetical protein
MGVRSSSGNQFISASHTLANNVLRIVLSSYVFSSGEKFH